MGNGPQSPGNHYILGSVDLREYPLWHIVGVVVGGIVFGVIVKMLTRYYYENRDNVGFVFLYQPLFMALPMAWMTSGLINSEAHSILILNLVAGWVFLQIAGSSTRRRRLEHGGKAKRGGAL